MEAGLLSPGTVDHQESEMTTTQDRTSDYFRCLACGKVHLKWSGVECPCGELFPTEYRDVAQRRARKIIEKAR